MNDRQRVLLVVALGLAVAVVVHTWDAVLSTAGDGGWFAYAPNTNPILSPDDDVDALRRGAMWLVGLAVWVASSFLILRGRSSDEDG